MLALLATMILGGAAPGVAQTRRRWEISWTFGGSSGGPAAAIQAAMSVAGLNSTSPGGCLLGFCGSPQPHPKTFEGGATATLAVSYAVRPWWSLRLQRTTTDLGETDGYHAPFDWLFLQQSVTSVSALAVISAGGLHLGVGPSLHRLAVTRMDGGASGSQRHQERSKVGIAFHSGLSLPARTRVFADIAVQYQLVGSMNIGPFTMSDSTTTMARTRGSFNYRTIKLGLGLRI